MLGIERLRVEAASVTAWHARRATALAAVRPRSIHYGYPGPLGCSKKTRFLNFSFALVFVDVPFKKEGTMPNLRSLDRF